MPEYNVRLLFGREVIVKVEAATATEAISKAKREAVDPHDAGQLDLVEVDAIRVRNA